MTDLVLAHGEELPSPLTTERVFTSWVVEWPVLLGLATLLLLYLWGAYRLHRDGVAWSRWRVLFWVLGLGLIFVATSSAVEVYDTSLFSAHALQHMILQMFAPVPLALAAPLTLALRALPLRGRRALLAVLHSPYARVITHPVVAFTLFVITPFVLYYSPLYEATLRNDWLHDLNHVHFVTVGVLLYVTILGLDPVPNRLPFLLRYGLIAGVGISHVLLGIPIMMGTRIFAEDFYLELGRTWGPTLIEDQQTGGALLWVLGDVTMLGFILGFLVQWIRSDAREARRIDRQLDRIHGDATSIKPWWETPSTPTPADQQSAKE